MKHLALVMIFTVAAFGAQAQQAIYRCGHTYSQKLCPDGKLIDSADPRSGAQRAEAKRAAAKEKQLAEKLERDRKAQETTGAASQAMSLNSSTSASSASSGSVPVSTPPKPKVKARKAKAASGVDFVAVVPSTSRLAQK